MQARALFTAAAGGLVAALATFVACSSGPAAGGGQDGGLDVVTVFETSPPPPDTYVAPEVGTPDTGPQDAGMDRARPGDAHADAHAVDAKLAACSLIKGACDIVSQNCDAGMECVVIEGSGGSVSTACMADQPTEKLPKGAACCPANDGTNPCDPGLECNGGGVCTGDGGAGKGGVPSGWGGARCTPRCCASDAGPNTANCGTADDGGIVGVCDLAISFTLGGPAEYNVCSYPSGCEPLRGSQCLSGFGCEIGDDGGPSCTVIYNPNGDAGATSGQPCVYGNSCADGLVCLGVDASTCQWMCKVPGSPAPFDAGLLRDAAGYGGCPSGQTCDGVIGFPSWLGACLDMQ